MATIFRVPDSSVPAIKQLGIHRQFISFNYPDYELVYFSGVWRWQNSQAALNVFFFFITIFFSR